MSTGQLLYQMLRRAGALLIVALVGSAGCVVDASEPYPDEMDHEEPAVMTGQELEPGSLGQGEDDGETTEDAPEKGVPEESSSSLLTDGAMEPDPDPWRHTELPGVPGGSHDDDESGGMKEPP